MILHMQKNLKSVIAVFFSVSLFLLAGSAIADDEDFEGASKASGCKLIPYDNLQKKCKKEQKKVTKSCKTDKMSCKGLGTVIGLRQKLNSKKKPPTESEKKELEEEIEELEEEIEDRLKSVKACIAARKSVQKVFEDTKDELEKEDAEEPNKGYIEKIIDEIEDGESGHQKVIDGYENAQERCEGYLE